MWPIRGSSGCAEGPVHYCTGAPIEAWSVVKIQRHHAVDTNHGIFLRLLARRRNSIRDAGGYNWPSFIAMDQPKHSAQRKTGRRCSRRRISTNWRS
jgi:hypothetical protein